MLFVDLIGQYQLTPKDGGKKNQMTTKNGKTVCLQAVTMIDPAIGWIEICKVPSARADLVYDIVELTWLTRYPLPNQVIVARGNELLAEFKTMIQANHCIAVKPILDDENLCDGILASTIFALHSTVHTKTQHTPAQLVFGQNSRLNTRHKTNWQIIKKRKQDLINK